MKSLTRIPLVDLLILTALTGIAPAMALEQLSISSRLRPNPVSERTDQKQITLEAQQTGKYTVNIDTTGTVNGRPYVLDTSSASVPTMGPLDPELIWVWKYTGGNAFSVYEFQVANTIWEDRSDVVTVTCVWVPAPGTGTGGCSRGQRRPAGPIDGRADGTAIHLPGFLKVKDLLILDPPDYLCYNEIIDLSAWVFRPEDPPWALALPIEANWSVEPVGEFGGGLSYTPGFGHQVSFTPTAPGRVRVTATETGPEGHSASVEFTIVRVVYNKDEVRPGIPENRKSTVVATIRPKTASPVISFVSSANRATVDEVSRVDDDVFHRTQVTLEVKGVNYSTGNRDTQIEALLNGETCKTLPVTVVKPASFYSYPLIAACYNPILGDDARQVVWRVDISKIILDDFDEILMDNWNGMLILESCDGQEKSGFSYPNGDPLAWGSINDPVTVFRDFDTEEEALACIEGFNPQTDDPVEVEQEIYAEYPEDEIYRNLGLTTIGMHLEMNVFTVTNTQ